MLQKQAEKEKSQIQSNGSNVNANFKETKVEPLPINNVKPGLKELPRKVVDTDTVMIPVLSLAKYLYNILNLEESGKSDQGYYFTCQSTTLSRVGRLYYWSNLSNYSKCKLPFSL